MIRINEEKVAVDDRYFWRSMATCPLGVKVQLLNPGGVACYGKVGGKDKGLWSGWAPLPKRRCQ